MRQSVFDLVTLILSYEQKLRRFCSFFKLFSKNLDYLITF